MPSLPDPRPQPSRQTVLLVEDEPATLRFCMAGLKGLQEFRLVPACNGAEALAILQTGPVDVVVTDLNMPVMDGFNLITQLASRYPSLPVIVLTSVAERVELDRAVALGALRILAKPPKLSLLMAEIRAAAAVEPQGIVQGLALASVLQLLNWERRTATLTVRAQEGVGYLYIRDGDVIQAASGRQEGLEAAYRILAWTGVHVEFVDACRVEGTIDLPLAELLLNAAMVEDERADAGPEAAPAAAGRPPDETWFG